jgi:hypothetical protein
MTTVLELHEQAMLLAQDAYVARRRKKMDDAQAFAARALIFELQAVALVPDGETSEPTRSMLYESAASLALQADDLKQAQRLVAHGLSGYPPPDVEERLKQLLEQINIQSHLAVRGVVLEENDVQLALIGNAVGQGDIVYSEFSRRIDRFTGLIDRTLQRLLNFPYRGSGRPPKDAHPFIPILSTPREGSFAVTVKLALPRKQYVQEQMLVSADKILEEVLYALSLIEEGRQADLQHRIQDPAYYRNFVSLTRDLAPDGQNIRHIGFTTLTEKITLSRSRPEISSLLQVDEKTKLEPIEVTGLLDYANARRAKKKQLGLTVGGEGEDKRSYIVEIEKGMEDIVRAYFQQIVIVRGMFNKDEKLIVADDIQAVNQ